METLDLSKPLFQATLEDLRMLLLTLPIDEEPKEEPKAKPHYVYGLAGLCKLLGCSKSTAVNIKKSGILDPAISQRGKIIVINSDYALELLKVNKNARGSRFRMPA